MNGQCLVAVYPSRKEAEQALQAALGAGIPSGNIRISDASKEQPHVWDWLFSSKHIPERDRAYYRAHLAEGRTALSVMLDSGASSQRADAIEAILARFNPVDVRSEQGEMEILGGGAATPSSAARATTGMTSERLADGEQIIPLLREELRVGVKAEDRVRHIRTYVVEEPIEREVSLADEQWIIEKRPASRKVDLTGGPIERAYELHELHESPIVEKVILADEELVVRKEPKRHTQQVRSTVRRTGVDVDKTAVTTGPATATSTSIASTAGASRPSSSSQPSMPMTMKPPKEPGRGA